MNKNRDIILSPVVLPLSTDKKYILTDVNGYLASHPINRNFINNLALTKPFSLDEEEGGVIYGEHDGGCMVICLERKEHTFFKEVSGLDVEWAEVKGITSDLCREFVPTQGNIVHVDSLETEKPQLKSNADSHRDKAVDIGLTPDHKIHSLLDELKDRGFRFPGTSNIHDHVTGSELVVIQGCEVFIGATYHFSPDDVNQMKKYTFNEFVSELANSGVEWVTKDIKVDMSVKAHFESGSKVYSDHFNDNENSAVFVQLNPLNEKEAILLEVDPDGLTVDVFLMDVDKISPIPPLVPAFSHLGL